MLLPEMLHLISQLITLFWLAVAVAQEDLIRLSAAVEVALAVFDAPLTQLELGVL
jgi:hypothetical protein